MAKLVDKAKEFVAEKMKQPEATIDDVDLVDVSSEAITYKAKVSVKNPYSLPIPIYEVSYNLKSKGRSLSFSLSLSLDLSDPPFVSHRLSLILFELYKGKSRLNDPLLCNSRHQWRVSHTEHEI